MFMREGSRPSEQRKGWRQRFAVPALPCPSATETQVRDKLPVSLQVCASQVLLEAPTLPNHLQKATTTVVVLLVVVEVSLQILDAGCQESNLDLGAATILLVELVLLDYFFAVKWHSD